MTDHAASVYLVCTARSYSHPNQLNAVVKENVSNSYIYTDDMVKCVHYKMGRLQCSDLVFWNRAWREESKYQRIHYALDLTTDLAFGSDACKSRCSSSFHFSSEAFQYQLQMDWKSCWHFDQDKLHVLVKHVDEPHTNASNTGWCSIELEVPWSH